MAAHKCSVHSEMLVNVMLWHIRTDEALASLSGLYCPQPCCPRRCWLLRAGMATTLIAKQR